MKNIDMLIQAFKNTFKGPEEIGFTAGLVNANDPRVTPHVGSKTATEYSTIPIGNQGFSIEDADVPGTFNNPWDFEITQQVLGGDSMYYPIDPKFSHWESVPSPFGNPNLATIDAFNRFDKRWTESPMVTGQLYNIPYNHDYLSGWNRVSDDPIAQDRGLYIGGGAVKYPGMPAGLGYKIGSALSMGNPLLGALMMAAQKK